MYATYAAGSGTITLRGETRRNVWYHRSKLQLSRCSAVQCGGVRVVAVGVAAGTPVVAVPRGEMPERLA
jgi:hypothetical protein